MPISPSLLENRQLPRPCTWLHRDSPLSCTGLHRGSHGSFSFAAQPLLGSRLDTSPRAASGEQIIAAQFSNPKTWVWCSPGQLHAPPGSHGWMLISNIDYASASAQSPTSSTRSTSSHVRFRPALVPSTVLRTAPSRRQAPQTRSARLDVSPLSHRSL